MRSKLPAALFILVLASSPLACSNGENPADSSSGGTSTAPNGGSQATSGGAASGAAPSGGQSGGQSAGGAPATGGAPSSGGAGGGLGGQAGELNPDLFVLPEGVALREFGGSEGGLTLTSLTFQATDEGFEFYAVVTNPSDEPICYGGITVNFFDGAEQVLAFWGESLFSQLYRMDEGLGGFIQCVEPRGTSMTGTQKLPDGIVLDQLETVEYSLPAFALAGVVLSEDVSVGPLQLVQEGAQTAFAGLVSNELDLTVTNPKLHIFTLTDEGRPVGMATASESTDIAAGETWSFETNTLFDTGAEAVTFVHVSLAE